MIDKVKFTEIRIIKDNISNFEYFIFKTVVFLVFQTEIDYVEFGYTSIFSSVSVYLSV